VVPKNGLPGCYSTIQDILWPQVQSSVIVYHRTGHAEAIEAEGFKDGEGHYLTAEIHRGVWVSDVPLDISEGERMETTFSG
jgi:hypothetical protein